MSVTADQSCDFVISRVFDAPREVVWKAFTQPERMPRWWGPKGFTVIGLKMDLRPGGILHYGLKTPDGSIVAPERLVVINSFSDEAGGITRHPMSSTWPLQMLSTFTFKDQSAVKTKLTVRWSTYNASEEEQNTFDSSLDDMRQGWTGTMDQLARYLATAK